MITSAARAEAVGGRLRRSLLASSAGTVMVVLALNAAWPLPGREEEEAWVIGLMVFPVAAAVVLYNRPRNVVGRLMAVVGVSAGLIFVLAWYAQVLPDGPLSLQLEALESVPAVMQFAGILTLLHLFPTGRPIGRWHARVVMAMVAYFAVMAVVGVLRPGPMVLTGRPNPFGVGPAWLADVWAVGAAGMGPFVLLGLWVVIARWRHAGPVERAQLKWFYAAAVWVAVTGLLMAIPSDDNATGPVVDLLVGAVVVVGFWSMPLAVVVAITRYRLYEIDRIISRTATYAVLTVFLAAVYVIVVVGLQMVLRPVTGQSDLAVAAATLTVAALFSPARRRVQAALERRFNRSRFDAHRSVETFRLRLRDGVDVDILSAHVLTTVRAAVQPVRVSLWRPR